MDQETIDRHKKEFIDEFTGRTILPEDIEGSRVELKKVTAEWWDAHPEKQQRKLIRRERKKGVMERKIKYFEEHPKRKGNMNLPGGRGIKIKKIIGDINYEDTFKEMDKIKKL